MSQETPLISIVTPVYNAEYFIDELMKSVLAQSYSNWELILVDDKSSDKSVAIIEQFSLQDKRIRLLKNVKNLGAAKTRNRGVGHANGRFIAFLDADDLWHPKKLEKQVDFMLKNGYAFTFTGYTFINSAGNKSHKSVIVPSKISYANALKRSPISTFTVMVDTTLIAKSDINMPDYTIGEDTATWWHLLKKYGDAHGIPESLSYYRRINKTLSSNKIEAALWRWRLYRNHESIGLLRSAWYFVHYVVYALERRV